MTALGFDLDQEVDLDASVSCAYKDCEAEATHRFVIATEECGCRVTVMFCTPHTEMLSQLYDELERKYRVPLIGPLLAWGAPACNEHGNLYLKEGVHPL